MFPTCSCCRLINVGWTVLITIPAIKYGCKYSAQQYIKAIIENHIYLNVNGQWIELQ